MRLSYPHTFSRTLSAKSSRIITSPFSTFRCTSYSISPAATAPMKPIRTPSASLKTSPLAAIHSNVLKKFPSVSKSPLVLKTQYSTSFLLYTSCNWDPILYSMLSTTQRTFVMHTSFPTSLQKTIWYTLLEWLEILYKGLPNRILVHQWSAFGEKFKIFGCLSHVDVTRTGVESHSSLRIVERYHQPLRTTFRKLSISYHTITLPLLLAMSVKAMNDTLRPKGLVPSSLVFGELPQLSSSGDSIITRTELASRAAAENQARDETDKYMDRLRFQRALRHKVPPASNVSY